MVSQVHAEREATMNWIETVADAFQQNGDCARSESRSKGVSNFASLIAFPCFGRWFMGADEGVVKVALVPVAVMLS